MSSGRSLRVAIIGAGIGGSTLSLALKRVGIHSRIFEQAKSLTPVGAAVTLTPNGLCVLDSLGLLPGIQQHGLEMRKLRVWQDNGEHIVDQDFSFAKRKHGYPLTVIERAALSDILHGALPTGSLNLGKKLVAISQPGDEVKLSFDDGTTETADVVVGADGLRSFVSNYVVQQTNPAQEHAKEQNQYTGAVAMLGYCGPVPVSPNLEPGLVHFIFGPGRVYGVWSFKDNKQFVVNFQRAKLPVTGSWSNTDAWKDVAEWSNYWHPYDAKRVANSIERVIKVGMYRKLPLEKWSAGRVTLLGDAAHAMLPSVGQGANMAIEDAAFLTNLLAARRSDTKAELSEIFKKYENERKPRVHKTMKIGDVVADLETTETWLGSIARKALFKYMPQWMFEMSVAENYSYQLRVQPKAP